ncbi:MAG: glycosyltransferase family 4 protein [Anaerolineales bacterium]|nr:glycosyltransferase family 4 protein [Anaerolineales bacterium]
MKLTRLLVDAGNKVLVLPMMEKIGRRYSWEILPSKQIQVAPPLQTPVFSDIFWLPLAFLRSNSLSGGLQSILYSMMSLVGLRRAVQFFQPDVIHNHLANDPFPVMSRALGIQIPLVFTHHHYETAQELKTYRRVIFPSMAMMETAVKESGYPENQARRVLNPVHSVFLSGDVPSDEERSGILFVGTIYLRKGIDLLIDAYRLEKKLHAVPLHVCGSGKDLPLVEKAIREEKFPILYEGQLSQEEISQRMRRVRLVVLPSRLESFPGVLSEAVCCGTPIVGWGPTVLELDRLLGMPTGIPFDGRTETSQILSQKILSAWNGDICHTKNRRMLAEAARASFSDAEFLKGNMSVYRELVP